MYEWPSFFTPIFKKKLPEITSTCPPASQALLSPRNTATPQARRSTIIIVKDGVLLNKDEIPSVIKPQGLSLQRQWYLFDKVRVFCPVADKDVTCPEPYSPAPRPASRHQIPEGYLSRQSTPLPKSRDAACGHCGEVGHIKRSCTQGFGPS